MADAVVCLGGWIIHPPKETIMLVSEYFTASDCIQPGTLALGREIDPDESVNVIVYGSGGVLVFVYDDEELGDISILQPDSPAMRWATTWRDAMPTIMHAWRNDMDLEIGVVLRES